MPGRAWERRPAGRGREWSRAVARRGRRSRTTTGVRFATRGEVLGCSATAEGLGFACLVVQTSIYHAIAHPSRFVGRLVCCGRLAIGPCRVRFLTDPYFRTPAVR